MNKKEENKKLIGLIVIAFVVGVIASTIAFATTTTLLRIGSDNNQAIMDPISWKVKFDETYNIQTNTITYGDTTVSRYPTVISDSKIDGFNVILKKTGDYVLFKMKIVNKGILNAKIDSVVLGSLTCSGTDPTKVADEIIVCDDNNLVLSLTYDDGITPVEAHTTGTTNALIPNQSVIVYLKLEYVGTIIPTNPVTIDISDTYITYIEKV